MILKDILKQLPYANRPVVKILSPAGDNKVLAIGLKAGQRWPDHQTPVDAHLYVFQGIVVYQEADKDIQLNTHDDMVIPVGVIHSLEALADSLCLLIQGSKEK